MSQQSLEILIKAMDGFSPTMGKFGNDLDTMKQKLKSIDDQFGDRSNFGKIQKMIMGGGAIGGIAMAGRILDDLSRKAVELKDAFNDGSKSASEVSDELARSIPILGRIYSATRNINELFTGSKANMKEMLELAESFAASLDQSTRKLFEMSRQNAGGETGAKDEMERWKDQLERMGLEGLELQEFDIKLKLKVDKQSFDADLAKEIADIEQSARGDRNNPKAGSINDLVNQRKALADREAELELATGANRELYTPRRRTQMKEELEQNRAEQKAIDSQIAAQEEILQARLKVIRDEYAAAWVEREKLAAAEVDEVRKQAAEKANEEAEKQKEKDIEAEKKKMDDVARLLAELDEKRQSATRDAMRESLDEFARFEFDVNENLRVVLDEINADRARLQEAIDQKLIDAETAKKAMAGLDERETAAKNQADKDIREGRDKNSKPKRDLEDAKEILRNAEMDELAVMAQLGDQEAAKRLDRLRIEERYLAIQKQLKEIAEDAAQSEEIRAQARAQIADNEALKARELAELEKKKSAEATRSMRELVAAYKGFQWEDGFGGGLASNIEQMNRLKKRIAEPEKPADPPKEEKKKSPDIPAPPASTTAGDQSALAQTASANQSMNSEQVRLLKGMHTTLDDILREFKKAETL